MLLSHVISTRKRICLGYVGAEFPLCADHTGEKCQYLCLLPFPGWTDQVCSLLPADLGGRAEETSLLHRHQGLGARVAPVSTYRLHCTKFPTGCVTRWFHAQRVPRVTHLVRRRLYLDFASVSPQEQTVVRTQLHCCVEVLSIQRKISSIHNSPRTVPIVAVSALKVMVIPCEPGLILTSHRISLACPTSTTPELWPNSRCVTRCMPFGQHVLLTCHCTLRRTKLQGE